MAIECKEILGVYRIVLYENKGVELIRPDISKKNEVDLIFSGSENYVLTNQNKPIWQRDINYSNNYKPVFSDKFIFNYFGLGSNDTVYAIRNNRNGFIVELQTIAGDNFVFPTPVFLAEISQLNSNVNSWELVMAYRQPTFQDKLKKLNTLIMNQNYVLSGLNSIAGGGSDYILIWK